MDRLSIIQARVGLCSPLCRTRDNAVELLSVSRFRVHFDFPFVTLFLHCHVFPSHFLPSCQIVCPAWITFTRLLLTSPSLCIHACVLSSLSICRLVLCARDTVLFFFFLCFNLVYFFRLGLALTLACIESFPLLNKSVILSCLPTATASESNSGAYRHIRDRRESVFILV